MSDDDAAAADASAPLDWDDLPASVQQAAVGAAARVLGAVSVDQLPAILARVARFTPHKRARRGAAPLARALEHDASFRALVAQHLPSQFGGDPAGPVAAVARAFLQRIPDSGELLTAANRADEVATLREQVVDLTTALDAMVNRMTAFNYDATGSEPHNGVDRVDADTHESDLAEIVKLRGRLRQQGTRVKIAEEAAQRAAEQADAARGQAVTEMEREQANAQLWRTKAEQEGERAEVAKQALDRMREDSGRERADSDRRLALLLDTIVDAAAGLKREWQLATGGADPVEVIARDLPAVDVLPQRSVDTALLLQWLRLPGAHLIIDGYNVTKTGYPDLPLADQRDRLVRSLGALVSRTGVDITVVFDGAAVVAPSGSTFQVRVVFSPPKVIADDVIRRMAAAEPVGRVLIVVSSDREVVDGVRRSGARTAPSALLLQVLG